MVYKIVISPEAFKELELAQCYFKIQDLKDFFLKDFNAQLFFLEKMPFSRQLRYKQVRIHLFEKFHYSIHYAIVENQIRILRILNQKQDF